MFLLYGTSRELAHDASNYFRRSSGHWFHISFHSQYKWLRIHCRVIMIVTQRIPSDALQSQPWAQKFLLLGIVITKFVPIPIRYRHNLNPIYTKHLSHFENCLACRNYTVHLDTNSLSNLVAVSTMMLLLSLNEFGTVLELQFARAVPEMTMMSRHRCGWDLICPYLW